MFPIKQYPVRIYCPLTLTEDTVYFHEEPVSEGYRAVFDGCDHQYHACDECKQCHKAAYQKLINK